MHYNALRDVSTISIDATRSDAPARIYDIPGLHSLGLILFSKEQPTLSETKNTRWITHYFLTNKLMCILLIQLDW